MPSIENINIFHLKMTKKKKILIVSVFISFTGANENNDGELLFKVKWMDFLLPVWERASVIELKFPQAAIEFYRSKLIWNDKDDV